MAATSDMLMVSRPLAEKIESHLGRLHVAGNEEAYALRKELTLALAALHYGFGGDLPERVEFVVTPILEKEGGRAVAVEFAMSFPRAELSLENARSLADMLLGAAGDAFNRVPASGRPRAG
jgi:hypothetical protein